MEEVAPHPRLAQQEARRCIGTSLSVRVQYDKLQLSLSCNTVMSAMLTFDSALVKQKHDCDMREN